MTILNSLIFRHGRSLRCKGLLQLNDFSVWALDKEKGGGYEGRLVHKTQTRLLLRFVLRTFFFLMMVIRRQCENYTTCDAR